VRSIEFQRFIDLVTFDQNLVKIERDIKKKQDVYDSLLADIQRLDKNFIDVKFAQQQARKAVDDKELAMKILDVQEADLKYKLASVGNQREYKSLEKETLAVNQRRMEEERDLLILWNKLDTLYKTYDVKSSQHEEMIMQYNANLDQIKAEITVLEEQLKQLSLQRQHYIDMIPQDWLDMYVNMRGKVINPVVPVVNDSCDACFYSITPRDLQMLRKSKLLQCKDCYRLLYIQD